MVTLMKNDQQISLNALRKVWTIPALYVDLVFFQVVERYHGAQKIRPAHIIISKRYTDDVAAM